MGCGKEGRRGGGVLNMILAKRNYVDVVSKEMLLWWL